VPKPEERDANPLQYGYFLMDLGLLSENAVKAQDFAKAARLFEAMAKAVPDEALGYRKACESYEKVGERDKALALCGNALTVHGVVLDDYARFSKLQLGSSAPLSAPQIEGLNQIIEHLKKESGAEVTAAQIECDLGVRLEDSKRLRRCTNVLAQKAPSDAKTLTYRWALAMQESDFDAARSVIEQAKKAAVEPKAIASMQAATVARSSLGARLAKYWKIEAVALLAIAAGFLFWVALRRRERLAPTPAS
jgi:tetratricopeptide (TPR) repeat protein